MKPQRCFGKNIFCGILLCLVAGCATTPEPTVQPNGFSIQRLEISSPVSVTSSYPAKMRCFGLEQVEILKGHFFWDSEGPFEYLPTDIDPQKGEIVFNLRTRKPGTYAIRGQVSYKDKQSGKIMKSNKVSAGTITAQ